MRTLAPSALKSLIKEDTVLLSVTAKSNQTMLSGSIACNIHIE